MKISLREIEVLTLISKGLNSGEISSLLHISQHTVNSHRKNLIIKLDARNTVHMVVKALHEKLILNEQESLILTD